MNRILPTLLLFLGVVSMVKGEPDVPPVPRLKTVPEATEWTIDYQYKGGPNPYLNPPTPADAHIYGLMEKEHPRFVSTKAIKSGKKKMEVTLFDDNTQTITCMVDDVVMVKDRLNNFIEVHSINEWGVTQNGRDFQSLDWINNAEYKGRQDFQGTTCCTYFLPAKEELTSQMAHIDAKTGLPVGVEIDKLTITYTFTPTTHAVELPPEFVARLKKYQNDQKLNAPGK
jgi:hypothetical protein